MHRIAVIAGDGVGKEVVPEGVKVLRAAAADLEFDDFDWGSERYLRTGRMMPEDALATLQGYDAIYLGACGWPTVPDHVSLWGLLLPIRKAFEQYVNLRPVQLPPGDRQPACRPGARPTSTCSSSARTPRESIRGPAAGSTPATRASSRSRSPSSPATRSRAAPATPSRGRWSASGGSST